MGPGSLSMRHTNLSRRGGTYYYRASFSLDGKVSSVRLSLKTSVRAVAHERAAFMDRFLKGKWKQIVDDHDGIAEADKASILRVTALKMRDSLEAMEAGQQANGQDDAEVATLDYLRTLRSFEHIARDIFANGVGPSFGSHDHFMDRFVEGMLHLGSDQLERIEEVLQHGPLLAASIQNAAEKALVERGIRVSPANLVLA